MIDILDIFLTKRDRSLNSSYRDEIIIKTCKNGEIKYFASTLVGFIKVEPYDVRGGYNENLFDNIKDVSLITDVDKTLPVYLVNPLFNLNKIMAVLVDGESGRHAIVLKTSDGKNLNGAYSLTLDDEKRYHFQYHFHKQDISVKREDIVNSIAKKLETLIGEKVRISNHKQNVNE